MSFKKVGGIYFIRIGRFGFNFYLARKHAAAPRVISERKYRQAIARSHALSRSLGHTTY